MVERSAAWFIRRRLLTEMLSGQDLVWQARQRCRGPGPVMHLGRHPSRPRDDGAPVTLGAGSAPPRCAGAPRRQVVFGRHQFRPLGGPSPPTTPMETASLAFRSSPACGARPRGPSPCAPFRGSTQMATRPSRVPSTNGRSPASPNGATGETTTMTDTTTTTRRV